MRVGHVLRGVLVQACADARVNHVTVAGAGRAAEYLRALAVAAMGPEALRDNGLLLDPSNKTALLLGVAPRADILLLGDLYYSQVVELAGGAWLPAQIADLAAACGGTDRLDLALFRFYDERTVWNDAISGLPYGAAERLYRALEAARFRRARVAPVAKLGARTLGIDLHA